MIQQKVAHSSKGGKLRIYSDEVFEDIIWIDQCEISEIPEGLELIQKCLKLALFCSEISRDRDALFYYRKALIITIKDNKIIDDYKELAQEAYNGLASLSFSDDEYVWESTSNTLEGYQQLFDDNDKSE